MVLLYVITEMCILTMMTFSINCLPRGQCDNYRRQKKGIMGPDPIFIEEHNLPLSYHNITTEHTVKTSEATRSAVRQTKKKWQVGRVSRKQYEIVNMIWRKTKIFLDTDFSTTVATTTTNNWNNDIRTYLTQRLIYKNAETIRTKPTESYIEFYYLDENDSTKKDKDNHSSLLDAEYIRNRPQISVKKSKKVQSFIANSPFLAFHINVSPQTKPSKTLATVPKKLTGSCLREQIKRLNFPFLYYNFFNNKPLSGKLSDGTTHISKIKRRSKSNVVLEDYKDQTCPITTIESSSITTKSPTTETSSINTESNSNDVEDTTFYDRIKFFELYDRQTVKNFHKDVITTFNKTVEKVLLKPTNVTYGHKNIRKNKTKKHVKESAYPHEDFISRNLNTKHLLQRGYLDYFSDNKINVSYNTTQETTEHKTHLELSKAVLWSDYPFAAVYVYEPSQILCDAAAISQHWLITSGACLSRQNRVDPSMEGRSAFVSYCGEFWRRPERITYVKYTLVHPKFNKQDRKRKFLYNIGLIQVVGSLMLSCPGWAPISLVSHQFTTLPEGSMASAVGWGLDRYAAKYPDLEIPLNPLMVYIGLVHSNHCPGNLGYNVAKLVEPLHVMKNIYCLSLPPYNDEETDPVHGSLLLIGGKLIALYLQEERREYGKQSALYTGIWKLIPWISEVAREPEETNTFAIDI